MVQIRESRAQGTSRSSGLGLFTALLYWETCALLAGPGNLGEFAELLGRLSPGTVTCSGSDVCVPPEVMCMPLCVCAPPEMMCVPLCTAGGGGFLFFPTRSKKEMGFSWSGLGNQLPVNPAQGFTTSKCLGLEPPRFYSGAKASALSTVCFDTLGRFIAHLGKKNWQLLLRNMEGCWEGQI